MWWVLDEQNHSQTDLSLLDRMGDSRYRSDAWAVFVNRYTRLFIAWFRRWGVDPHTMEDVLQETLMRVLSDIKFFERRKHGSFRSWLKTLAHNSWSQLIIDTERQLAQRDIDPARVQNWGLLRTKSAEEHLMKLLDDLANKELLSMAHSRVRLRVDLQTWETYRGVVMEQSAIPDVAATLMIPASQIYSNIFRVRRMLKEELQELDSPSA
jgi:RNA polymerase sigma factor (sigma-70 family)